MSFIQSDFPYQFKDVPYHVNVRQLNEAYGDKGKSFTTFQAAWQALEQEGFVPSCHPHLWIGDKQKAYLTVLKERQYYDPWDGSYISEERYIMTGVLVTYSGNEPYWKV